MSKLHGEAPSVGGGDQFLRIGAGPSALVNEATLERVGLGSEGAALHVQSPGAFGQRSIPSRGGSALHRTIPFNSVREIVLRGEVRFTRKESAGSKTVPGDVPMDAGSNSSLQRLRVSGKPEPSPSLRRVFATSFVKSSLQPRHSRRRRRDGHRARSVRRAGYLRRRRKGRTSAPISPAASRRRTRPRPRRRARVRSRRRPSARAGKRDRKTRHRRR